MRLDGGALRRMPRVGHWLIALGAAGWAVVGIVPADVDENTHLLGALGILIGTNAGLVALIRSRTDCVPGRAAAWSAPVLGVVGLVGAVLFATRHDLGIGPGGMERVAAYGVLVWMVVVAVAILTRTGGRAGSRTRRRCR